MSIPDRLPCPILITDGAGCIEYASDDFLRMVGKSEAQVLQHQLEECMPPASRILLQTHLWPLLLKNGELSEIHLKLSGPDDQRIPVMLNCRRSADEVSQRYYWVFFVAAERSQFEAELLAARDYAQQLAQTLARRERFILNIANNLPGMLAYWGNDLICRFANNAYKIWFDKSAEEVVGLSMLQLLGERLFALNEPYVRATLMGQAQTFERILTRADGSIGQTLANYIPDIDPDGKVAGFFVLVTDVSAFKDAQAGLKLAASVFQNTREGIMVSDANGSIISVNPAFSAITGFSASDVIGQATRILNDSFYSPQVYAARLREIAEKGRWEGEVWSRRKNGEAFLEWQSISLIPGESEQALRYVSVFNDVTERWKSSEHIKHLAFHDPLTDLPNRALLLERLGQLIVTNQRNIRQAALLFLDLDGFKQINDTLGHEIGDDLLKVVGKVLLDEVRQGDTVARLGGDEFVILLDNLESPAEVECIAARIIASFAQVRQLRGQTMQVGVSIGIALFPQHGSSAAELLAHADSAMYAVKHAGKNGWCVYNAVVTP